VKSESKKFLCNFCSKSFTRNQNLKYHLENSCKNYNYINDKAKNKNKKNSEIAKLKNKLKK
jgi:hydrogenase maturation factor HypF (carbamoyltransferase family)